MPPSSGAPRLCVCGGMEGRHVLVSGWCLPSGLFMFAVETMAVDPSHFRVSPGSSMCTSQENVHDEATALW